jgi:hypothetical protein
VSLKHFAISGILLSASFAGACGGGYVAYRVPPPPAPQFVGAVGYAPGPGYVWVDGFWDLRGGNWVWASGRWAHPPRPRAVWVADRWERHGEHWRYQRGHWR